MNARQSEKVLEQEAARARHRPDERPYDDESLPAGSAGGDVHAAGSPSGGSAIGGLGGTNLGDGSIDDADLEEAMGSGQFDADLEEQDAPPYSGPHGGAVGGTPAEKRVEGGTTGGGIDAGDSGRDGTIGVNPKPRQPR